LSGRETSNHGTARAARVARGGEDLAARYEEIRRVTERLAAPLSAEDCAGQSMPDASPIGRHFAPTARWQFTGIRLARDA